MLVGALDPTAWAGLVLCTGPGCGAAIRLAVDRDGERADGDDFFYLVHEVGPHAPDFSYARVAFDTALPFGHQGRTPIPDRGTRSPTLVWEWTSAAATGVGARCVIWYAGGIEVRGYAPWDWTCQWSVVDGALRALLPDGRAVEIRLALDRQGTDVNPERAMVEETGDAVVRYRIEPGDVLRCTASEGGLPPSPSRASVDRTLERARGAYEAARVTLRGPWAGLESALTNNLHWMIALQPEHSRLYTPAGRRWIFPRSEGGREPWTIFCWDSFFNALELAVESPALARSTLDAVLGTQYPNGNIPNWRGRFGGTPDRSQPPLGSYAVLTYYLRTGDRDLLERAFPILRRWSAWWRAPKAAHARRDGNGNGLFEWGSDLALVSTDAPPWERSASHHQKAAWESGQDDLPSWDQALWMDQSETLNLESVDLNTYLVLDDQCLAQIARVLGDPDTAAAYTARAARHAALINQHLWNDERGMYVDRFWDGRRSERLAAANFFPLVAGIPDRERAQRMVDVLHDNTTFWGPFVVPTISRNDAAFAAQQYWRGSVWGPPNYLIYQGLRRYGFDALAGELAASSVNMLLENWRRFGLCSENYDSRTGAGGGQRYQSWGPLFALIGIGEWLDVTPWDGVRVGTRGPTVGTVEHLPIKGRSWAVGLTERELRLWVDGVPLLHVARSSVLRDVTLEDGTFEAVVESAVPAPLVLDGRRASWQIDVAEQRTPRDQGRADLPAGRCHVRAAPGMSR